MERASQDLEVEINAEIERPDQTYFNQMVYLKNADSNYKEIIDRIQVDSHRMFLINN